MPKSGFYVCFTGDAQSPGEHPIVHLEDEGAAHDLCARLQALVQGVRDCLRVHSAASGSSTAWDEALEHAAGHWKCLVMVATQRLNQGGHESDWKQHLSAELGLVDRLRKIAAKPLDSPLGLDDVDDLLVKEAIDAWWESKPEFVMPPPQPQAQGIRATLKSIQAAVERLAPRASTTRRGRPRAHDPASDQQLADEWKRAREGAEIKKAAFCENKGISVEDLNRALARVRKRRNHAN